MKIVDLLYCTLIIYLKIIKVHSNNDINKNQSNNLINTNHQFFKNSLSIQQAYIIALDTLSAKYTAKQALHYLNIPNITIFPAINGTAALQQMPPLSLYTQYLLYYHTRHDHMQLSTAPMLGCLLSHIHLWTQAIEMNQSLIAIFEEDAIFDEMSNERLQGLLLDLNKNNTIWDILMLESGSVLAQGPWKSIGKYAATCAKQPCSWFGTRGYLLTNRGAKILLQHVYPISVQVDALIALVAAFHPNEFHMYWTRENIVHLRYARISTIWEGCIKCYLPAGPIYYLCTLIVFLLFTCVLKLTNKSKLNNLS